MATLFPHQPAGTLTPEATRVFRWLKSLSDDFAVWLHLAPWQPKASDFLILNRRRQALLLKVSQARRSELTPAAQLLLLSDDRRPLGEAEGPALAQFRAGVNDLPVATVLLCPNLTPEALAQAARAPTSAIDHWGHAADLQDGVFPAGWFSAPALDPADFERLRACFNPEVVVPPTLTVRQPDPRRLRAGLTHFLLDYNQEAALKNELVIPATGEALSRDFRLNLVNGVAGSGKTLILLYRLRLLQALYPQKRFLVLTHNRPLIRDLKARFIHLTGGPGRRVEWDTFSGWCYHHWPAEPAWVAPLGAAKRARLINAVHAEFLTPSRLTPGMLLGEIDWFKDQGFMEESEYLAADRRGRGFGLTQEQRRQVFAAMSAYQKRLEAAGAQDWGDAPRKLWALIQSEAVQLPQYDVVLVDEAQFFAPVWFEIVRRLVVPDNGHLFLAADPTQGFLGRGASWRALGLEVRGRSFHLNRSYRTTHEILNFATLFYRARVAAEPPEEEILTPNLLDMPGGAVPQVIQLRAGQEELARVANEVADLLRQGVPAHHILVLHAGWRGVKGLIAAINRATSVNAAGVYTAGDPKDRLPGDYVRVTTLNAGTGLEAPIVFLVGLRALFEEEQSLRISDEEREELVRANTRRIYMAATRAAQRLIFTYIGELPPVLRDLPSD